jgi:hypothetical protein
MPWMCVRPLAFGKLKPPVSSALRVRICRNEPNLRQMCAVKHVRSMVAFATHMQAGICSPGRPSLVKQTTRTIQLLTRACTRYQLLVLHDLTPSFSARLGKPAGSESYVPAMTPFNVQGDGFSSLLVLDHVLL